MMGKGAEGGCAANSHNSSSKFCFISFSKSQCQSNKMNRSKGTAKDQQIRGLDVFSQAYKALAVKPVHGEGRNATSNSYLTMASASENRRKPKLKRSDISGAMESSLNKDLGGSRFWVQMEEYFRDPTSDDIQILFPKTKLGGMECFNSVDPLLEMPMASSFEKPAGLSGSDSSLLLDTEHINALQSTLSLKLHGSAVKTKRKLPTASSACKRRRIVSPSDAFLTAIISPPENEDEELCDVCYGGDCDEQNQILFCDSCNVAVHQQCYGIKVVPKDHWLCSFCSYRRRVNKEPLQKDLRDCAFCPVKGGALKLIATTKDQLDASMSNAVFGHLFCCQWIPETYIGDMDSMEPIMNVEGVRGERWKLICNICKEKYGACIQCSHGMCAAAFHPLCARQARLRMEVSRKRGSNELGFQAFCSKHSIKLAIGKQSISEAPGTTDSNDLLPRMIESYPENCRQFPSSMLGISVLTDDDGDREKSLCIEDNNAGEDGKPILVNGKTDAGSCTISDNDAECPLKTMETSSDRESPKLEGVPDKLNAWIGGLSNNCLLNGELPSIEGTYFANDEKDFINCNSKDTTFRTYVNKRRKVEKSGKLLSLRKQNNFDLSGEDIDQMEKVQIRDIASAKAHLNVKEKSIRGEKILADCQQNHEESFMHDDDQELNSDVSSTVNGMWHSGRFAKLHPFVLKRLVEGHYNATERSYEPGINSIVTSHPPYCKFLASASHCTEIDQTNKVSVMKSYHRKSDHSCCISKSSKNRIDESVEAQLKQLEHAKNLGILDMSPENELEEEIIGSQMSLISFARQNYNRCEKLIFKIIPCISKNLRASSRKAKNLSLVNQYMAQVIEAKKQGRKERRSKEAQAILAATTAVAAASSRSGSFRREMPGGDVRESFCSPLPLSSRFSGINNSTRSSILKATGYGQSSPSQTSSCGLASPVVLEKSVLDSRNYSSEISCDERRESLELCDICKDPCQSDASVVCQRCKVTVHHHCYPLDVISTSYWHCQPCSEILHQHQGFDVPNVADRASPGQGVLCSICLQESGAFKRSISDMNWVHVFCSQWLSQMNAEKDDAGSLDSVKLSKNLRECCICHLRQGAHLRCSFGHCHCTFHPICARDSGFYMIVRRASGNRIQYRAYCEKHSPQQRQKADSKRTGTSEELSALRQMRAELERVRILCERVSKRERIKRDQLLCMIDWYTAYMSLSVFNSTDYSAASNTQDTPFSFHEPVVLITKPYGVESESQSWNSIAGHGNRYLDSHSGDSVYQTPKSWSDLSKETPLRSQMSDATVIQDQGCSPVVSEPKKLKKHLKAETLHTEMVMTPTEASVQNQRLPKGYAYVPVGVPPKGKLSSQEAHALKEI